MNGDLCANFVQFAGAKKLWGVVCTMYRVELDGDIYPPGGAKWQVISPLGQASSLDYFISGSFVKIDLRRLVILSIGYKVFYRSQRCMVTTQ